jgi:RpiR family transcriptional regulator, carbohydrate utilization regulator
LTPKTEMTETFSMSVTVTDPSIAGDSGLDIIRSRLGSLSKAERRIAESILDQPADAVRVSITELADRAGVGEATVSRFCRRLGFRGFQDLKISIATNLQPGAANRVWDLPTGSADSQRAFVHDAARRAVGVLDRTAALLQPDRLELAVQALVHARKVDIYGQGASAVTALDAQHAFMRVGMAAYCLLDAHGQAMSASLLRSGDVTLAFSHSGSTRDVVSTQRAARDNGAHTICVTSAARSPLAAASTTVLLTAGEDTLVSNLRSKMTQLFVLQLLTEGCARQIGNPAQNALAQTTAAVVEKMY